MRRLPPFDARGVAVTASLAAASLLGALLLWGRDDVVTVGMALLCVLCTVTAGVAASASRQQRAPVTGMPPAEHHVPGGSAVDADTLEAFDCRDALHAVDVRQRRAGRLSDR
ncbi:hypothetical protein [Micromonospora rosaria]|uniref:hypothetical protein n=1 Tax=Micromonospora rosaria TaxID=47874 RepID=UPI0012FB886D|nr:hypothetical protein [Micromonospora rosaria]